MKILIRRLVGPLAVFIVRRLQTVAKEEMYRRSEREGNQIADRIVTAFRGPERFCHR